MKAALLIPLALTAVAAQAKPLKFMTFNIRGEDAGGDGLSRETVAGLVAGGESADVVSLQDVAPDWYKSQMSANLEKTGYAVVRGDESAALKRAAFAGGKKAPGRANRVPLLYKTRRLKMLASGTEFFNPSLDIADGATWAVFEDRADARRFAVVGAHFWRRSGGAESDAIREMSARLVLSILSNVRRKWGADLPAILGGDLNSPGGAAAHAVLESGGFMNAAILAEKRSPRSSRHARTYFTRGVRPLRQEIIAGRPASGAGDGPAAVMEFDLAPSAPAPKPQRGMRLMNYNIRHGAGADGVLDLRRTADVILRENPDFAGINEVDCRTSRSAGIDEAAELGRLTGMHAVFAQAIPLAGGSYGNAILSREKPVSSESVPLPGKEPRVLLLCEFKDFWFCTAHFDFGKYQQETVETIRKAVALKSAAKPVFVSGDWNASPDSKTLAAMKEFMTVLSDESRPTFHAFKPRDNGTELCIDYIAVDSAHAKLFRPVAARVSPEAVASDHHPITVDVATPSAR